MARSANKPPADPQPITADKPRRMKPRPKKAPAKGANKSPAPPPASAPDPAPNEADVPAAAETAELVQAAEGGRCTAIKADGVRCRGHAIRGSAFCLFHDKSRRGTDARDEGRSAGGLRVHGKNPAPKPTDVPIPKFTRYEDILAANSRTIHMLWCKQIDAATGLCVARLLDRAGETLRNVLAIRGEDAKPINDADGSDSKAPTSTAELVQGGIARLAAGQSGRR